MAVFVYLCVCTWRGIRLKADSRQAVGGASD